MKQKITEIKRRLEHFRDHPSDFIRRLFSVQLEPWQAETLDSLVSQGKVSIRSGHGVGKTSVMSMAIIWFLLTRFPAKVPCTAPTHHQLRDVLWAELAKWHRRMPDGLREQFELKADRFELREAPSESFAVTRTARKEAPEALQGFHSKNMMFVIDEASGIEEMIFQVAEGALSTEGAKIIMASNPTRLQGYFYDSHHKRRAQWRAFHVSCLDSGLVSKDYIREMREKYGVDSDVYRVRVLGEFPKGGDDLVIPLYLVESAENRDVAPLKGHRTIWGLDVARFGSDATALIKRCGNKILEPTKVWYGKDLMQTAGIVKAEYEDAEQRPDDIMVDSIGLGAGVVDRLQEMGLPVRGVNVAEAAAVQERYMRLRDELWFRVREWFDKLDVSIADDPHLIAELTIPHFSFTSGGKLRVESKDDIRKRGIASPDRADALCLTFASGLERKDLREDDRYYREPKRHGSSWTI